jgi:competence protein ComEC
MLWYYYLVTPVSLLANLVVVPIAFFVLACGLLSIVAAPLSGSVSVVFNNTNWFLTKLILGIVHLFAQIPGGHSYVERPHWPGDARMEITALDLKSGGALHVRTPESDWLFDTGSLRAYDRIVRQYLRSKGVNRLDGLVLTHGDAGHMGGAGGALLDFRPRLLIDTATADRSPTHRRLIAELARSGIPRRLCTAGDEFDLSRDVRAKILFPPREFVGAKADDQALVIQLAVSGKSRVLIMSDSGVATEEYLARNYPDLRSDIVVKGQHYSGLSGSDTFLASVQPRAIVATSLDFPENERLKNEWVERVSALGIKLFRQDETGAVRISVFRDRWEARAYVTSETFRSTSR